VVGAVGAAVGLAAASVALGFVLGRGTAPGATLTPSPSATPAQFVPPRSGPTIFVAGVPVGYAPTRDGAIAAATAYQQYLFGEMLLHPDDLKKAVTAVAVPDHTDVLIAKFTVASNVLEQRFQMVTATTKGIPTVVLTFPLTTQVMSYDGVDAKVRIYTCTVLAEQGVLAPATVWGTVVVSVRRTRDDWQLVDSSVDSTVPAIIPSVEGTPVTAPTVPPQFDAFQQYIYSPPPASAATPSARPSAAASATPAR
jgi:hypothetical protein